MEPGLTSKLKNTACILLNKGAAAPLKAGKTNKAVIA